MSEGIVSTTISLTTQAILVVTAIGVGIATVYRGCGNNATKEKIKKIGTAILIGAAISAITIGWEYLCGYVPLLGMLSSILILWLAVTVVILISLGLLVQCCKRGIYLEQDGIGPLGANVNAGNLQQPQVAPQGGGAGPGVV